MATMALSAAGSLLTVTTAIHMTSTQVEYDVCQFTFDAAWAGYSKTAVFYADPTNVVEVVLVADACDVPWDAFAHGKRYLYVGVYGTNGTSVLPTNFVEVAVAPGANVDATPSRAPTPSVYAQLLTNIDDLSDGLNIVEGIVDEHTLNIANNAAAILALSSGAPAGTYANLAALNAGTPTAPDVTKIYITLDDGKWCYHNGAAWVAGGVYQASGLDATLVQMESDISNIANYSGVGFQYLEAASLENKYYYDWNVGHTAIQKNFIDDAIWNCIKIENIPAGTYHYNHCFALFTFVENVSTSVITDGATAGFANSAGSEKTVTIPYTFNLYLTTNIAGISGTAMFGNKNLPVVYADGYYKAPQWEVNADGQTTYIVGNGYFNTIKDACDRAANDDIVYIKSGTYEENVKLWTRRLHLIGENKLNTVLIDHTGNYDTPPLEMSDGSVSNMTIIQDNTAPTGTPGDGKYGNSYCIHADWTPVALGNIFEIDNCIIINKVWATVGIGLQPDYKIRIRNTQMIGEGPTGAWTILAHDSPTNNTYDQFLIVQNCLISSVSGSCVLITKVASTGGEAWYQFDGCVIWDETSGTADTIVNLPALYSGFEKIKSYGNTVAALNN